MAPIYRKIIWTEHSKIKMKQYGLSVSKLLNILYKPERKEKAIVPGLVAVMKSNPAKSKKVALPFLNRGANNPPKAKAFRRVGAPGEIWIMYKDTKNIKDGKIRKIISAWRYPGITKPGEEFFIPSDTRQELENQNFVV